VAAAAHRPPEWRRQLTKSGRHRRLFLILIQTAILDLAQPCDVGSTQVPLQKLGTNGDRRRKRRSLDPVLVALVIVAPEVARAEFRGPQSGTSADSRGAEVVDGVEAQGARMDFGSLPANGAARAASIATTPRVGSPGPSKV